MLFREEGFFEFGSVELRRLMMFLFFLSGLIMFRLLAKLVKEW